MHLFELLACFGLRFCILPYTFVVSIKNLDLDSEYDIWLATRKKWRGCDKNKVRKKWKEAEKVASQLAMKS